MNFVLYFPSLLQMFDGKASVYNAGDLGSIPGSGSFLEKEKATHSSTFAQKTPWTEEPGVHGVTKSRTRLSNFTQYSLNQQNEYAEKQQDIVVLKIIMNQFNIIKIYTIFTQQQDTNSIQVSINYKLEDTGSYPGTQRRGKSFIIKTMKNFIVSKLIFGNKRKREHTYDSCPSAFFQC